MTDYLTNTQYYRCIFGGILIICFFLLVMPEIWENKKLKKALLKNIDVEFSKVYKVGRK